ncbi:MAG: hypothetical protein M3356_02570 [Actinomycetota bacterium]|nr:hypothetical protein [Actinomycetota bacterium]
MSAAGSESASESHDTEPAGRRRPTAKQRLRQGLALVLGAAVFGATVAAGSLAFYWTPLGIGLAYLLAAAVNGRRGSYWATAVTLTGWGAAVVWLNELDPDVFAPAAHVFGIGAGVLAGALLGRAGFAVDQLGVGVTAFAAGALFMSEQQVPEVLGDASTYAAFIAVVGVVNVAWALSAVWNISRRSLSR